MRTLDEVIKIFETFSKERSDLYEGPSQSLITDALHYLKEYKVLKYIWDEIKQYNPEIKILVDEFVSKVEGAK